MISDYHSRNQMIKFRSGLMNKIETDMLLMESISLQE
jgi:hypothetical protein